MLYLSKTGKFSKIRYNFKSVFKNSGKFNPKVCKFPSVCDGHFAILSLSLSAKRAFAFHVLHAVKVSVSATGILTTTVITGIFLYYPLQRGYYYRPAYNMLSYLFLCCSSIGLLPVP